MKIRITKTENYLKIEKIAKKANLNRESFYKIFKPNSKPRFETISKILRAFDMNLSVSA